MTQTITVLDKYMTKTVSRHRPEEYAVGDIVWSGSGMQYRITEIEPKGEGVYLEHYDFGTVDWIADVTWLYK